jgi:hypothetical protein
VVYVAIGFGGGGPLMGMAVVALLCLAFTLRRELTMMAGGQTDRARLREYAGYGLPVALSLILALVISSTDRFLLAAFLDEEAVGVYHAGYSLANRTLDVMFIWLGMAGGPAMVQALERGGRTALAETAREQSSFMVLLTLPAAVGVALVAGNRFWREILREDDAAIGPGRGASAELGAGVIGPGVEDGDGQAATIGAARERGRLSDELERRDRVGRVQSLGLHRKDPGEGFDRRERREVAEAQGRDGQVRRCEDDILGRHVRTHRLTQLTLLVTRPDDEHHPLLAPPERVEQRGALVAWVARCVRRRVTYLPARLAASEPEDEPSCCEAAEETRHRQDNRHRCSRP